MLRPSFAVPVGVGVLGLVLLPWVPLVGVVVLLFTFFLTYQTATLRIVFTESAFEVTRRGQVLVAFPYADWLDWRIFWPPLPVLFYFREVKSIHFIPMLFDRAELEAGLLRFVGKHELEDHSGS